MTANSHHVPSRPDDAAASRAGPFAEAAHAFFLDAEQVEPVATSGEVARVTTPDGVFALRRWEPATTAAHIEFVHAALERARAAGVEGVPASRRRHDRPDEAAVLVAGRLYDAQDWLPGRPLHRQGAFPAPDGVSINLPLHPSTPVDAAVADAARLIGRFHTATGELASHPDAPQAPLALLLQVVRDGWDGQRRRLGPLAASTSEVRRWLRCGNRVIPIARDRLQAASDVLQDTGVVTHGGLWPSHLIVDADGKVTGVVDWRRAAAGSSLLDLAHLATHVSGWSAARAELILGAYSEEARLLPEQRRLLPVVAALDLLAEVSWLLGLSFADDGQLPDRVLPFVRGGAKTLLTSLESLTDVLAPPEPRTARRWVPGPRRPKGSGRAAPTRPPRERAGRSPRRSPPRRPGPG